jgi:hypothetical protein
MEREAPERARERQREREREREGGRQRETDRQTDRQTDRERDTERERERERERQREKIKYGKAPVRECVRERLHIRALSQHTPTCGRMCVARERGGEREMRKKEGGSKR